MPSDDVWGGSWADSWNGYWKTAVENTAPEDGFLPSLNQRGLTRAQLRRRRNQRYRYLKELE